MSRWTRKYGRAPISLPEPEGAEVAAPMYHRILVPLDHTVLDRLAVSHAAAMGKLYGARIFLLHVEEGVTSQVYGPAASTAEVEAGEVYLERIAQSLRDQGVSVETADLAFRLADESDFEVREGNSARPGDYGGARARRAEGPDLRHDDQSGEASSGRADADCAARKELRAGGGGKVTLGQAVTKLCHRGTGKCRRAT